MSTIGDPKCSHFLRIPFEMRTLIYKEISLDIESSRLNWQRNRTTEYDGLRSVCRQIYNETTEKIFSKYMTQHQPPITLRLEKSKSTFIAFRSLQIELDFDFDSTIWNNFAKVLDRFQLSLQDVGLFFVGRDTKNEIVRSSGCSLLEDEYHEKLKVEDQDFGKKMMIMRQLLVLKNLQVLRIENLNMPIPSAVFMQNKPHLQAFSARTDPRSVVHNFEKLSMRERKYLLRSGLDLGYVDYNKPPPIKALELDINAAQLATYCVIEVVRTLEHLSWRVPLSSYQSRSNWTKCTWNDTDTIRMLHHLAAKAPNLKTLRLCLQSSDVSSHPGWASSQAVTLFQERLPQLKIKSFELHGLFYDEFSFFSQRLISRLPVTLERLYISDTTIQTRDIFRQVWQWCFGYEVFLDLEIGGHQPYDGNSSTKYASDNDFSEEITINMTSDSPYTLGNNNLQKSTRDDILLVPRLITDARDTEHRYGNQIGEQFSRCDKMICQDNDLTFVTVEFDKFDLIDPNIPDQTKNVALLLLMNGRLIDKGHNRHIWATTNVVNAANTWESSYDESYTQEYEADEVSSENAETATSSCHLDISIKLYEAQKLRPSEAFARECAEERDACEGMRSAKWNWYFGNEDEAMEKFKAEPVARIEDQHERLEIDIVDVEPAARCRWMCPDAQVGAISEFPEPPVPADWKD